MLNKNYENPGAATGQPTAAATSKRGFGDRYGFCARTVDHWLAEGLPHLKVGKRRVRIIIADGDAWMKEKFGRQSTQ